MRLNIEKLQAAGFRLSITKEEVTIQASPIEARAWERMRDIVKEAGITDPGLQDYVLENCVRSLTRAQILQLAE